MRKKAAVIGYPLTHSLSPVMHNAAFSFLNLDAVYEAVEIPSNQLIKFLDKIRDKQYLGVNITVPYKTEVIKYLDSVSLKAKRSNSVNCIINRDGALHGDTTDGYGLEMAVKEEFGINSAVKEILYIGCGGAAQATASHFLENGTKKILFLNRSLEKAESFAQHLKSYYPLSEIKCATLDDSKQIKECMLNSPLVIHSTSLGLKKEDPFPLNPDFISENSPFIDMLYWETNFQKELKSRGISVADGRLMLLYQGAESFRLWTNLEPPIKIMREALFTAIKNRTISKL